jgi:hypothetical protein
VTNERTAQSKDIQNGGRNAKLLSCLDIACFEHLKAQVRRQCFSAKAAPKCLLYDYLEVPYDKMVFSHL